MLIAVISDTHSRTASVQTALQIMAERNVDLILHCGDIQDGATVRLHLVDQLFFAVAKQIQGLKAE